MNTQQLYGYQLTFDNPQETLGIAKEIFKGNCYYFETNKVRPVIIDAGAHIGLASLYFKSLYPQAIIIALEPNPDNFALLQTNIEQNQIEDIELNNLALWDGQGAKEFFLDRTEDRWYSTSGFIKSAWNQRQKSRSIQVVTKPLSDFLDREIDLLKLDIEGVEERVLLSAGPKIRQVNHLIFEFHPTVNNQLKSIEKFLRTQGFVQIHQQKEKTNRGDLIITDWVRGK